VPRIVSGDIKRRVGKLEARSGVRPPATNTPRTTPPLDQAIRALEAHIRHLDAGKMSEEELRVERAEVDALLAAVEEYPWDEKIRTVEAEIARLEEGENFSPYDAVEGGLT